MLPPAPCKIKMLAHQRVQTNALAGLQAGQVRPQATISNIRASLAGKALIQVCSAKDVNWQFACTALSLVLVIALLNIPN